MGEPYTDGRHAAEPGLTAAALARAGIHLDPEEAAAEEACRARRANTVVYPRVRLIGFALLSAAVLLHGLLLGGRPAYPAALGFGLAALAYSVGSWLVLRRFYAPRPGSWDLGDALFVADLVFFGAAIYVTGATESWLFFVPLVRVADQVHGGPRRALVFAHLGVLTYGAVVAIAAAGGAAPLPWAPELLKLFLLYVAGLYLSLAAGPAERLRRKTNLAVAYATDLIRRLEARTIELAHQTNRAQRLRQDAEEATKAQARLLSRVSHEFRTPLNHILGFSQLLDLSDLTRDQRENVQEIVRGGRRLLMLVDQVLRITGGEMDEDRMRFEPVDVSELLDQVLLQLRPVIEAKELTVERNGNALERGRIALASPRHLQQVLWQLLSNAVKHNRHGGRIDITVAEEADRVHVGVTDTGPGIAPERLESLFDPFGSLGEKPTGDAVERDHGGIGIATARTIVNALGGQLRATSQPGRGTSFYFDVPAVGGAVALVD